MRLSPLGQGARFARVRTRRPLPALGDERLGDLIARGDHEAFEVLFDRHYGGVLALARQILGTLEEAEDATQQAFLSAYKDLAGEKRPDRLKAWLYTIARNRCLSMLRARREQPAELEHVAVAGFTEHVEQRAELRSLLSDLAELPEQQRSAIVLAEVGDLPHAEIAQVLSIEPKQVKALVFQARSGLSHRRLARDTPCERFREQIAVSAGGSLLRGPLRRHLGSCPHCSEFREEIREQRRLLSIALPVVASLTLKQEVLAATGGGAAGSGAAGTGAAGSGAASGAGVVGGGAGSAAGVNGAAGVGAAAKGALATGAAGGAGVGAPAAPGLAGILGSGAAGGKIAAAAALLSKVGVAQAATVAVVAGGGVVGGGAAIRAARGDGDRSPAESAPEAGKTPTTPGTVAREARSRAGERRERRERRVEARARRAREDARTAGEGPERRRSKASRREEAAADAERSSDAATPRREPSGQDRSSAESPSGDSNPRGSTGERAEPRSASSPERSSEEGSPAPRPPDGTSTPEPPKVETPSVPKAPEVPSAPKLP